MNRDIVKTNTMSNEYILRIIISIIFSVLMTYCAFLCGSCYIQLTNEGRAIRINIMMMMVLLISWLVMLDLLIFRVELGIYYILISIMMGINTGTFSLLAVGTWQLIAEIRYRNIEP